MEKVLETLVKIRFQDCDPLNHLHNTKYLDYLLNARENQVLESYGIDTFEALKKTGLTWVISSNQIVYLKPAVMMELVLIDSILIDHTETSLMIEIRMWDEQKIKLKSLLWTKLIYFNKNTQKRSVHSSEIATLFKNVVLPVEQSSFEERVSFMTKQFR
jgi:thioesterase-3